MIYFLVPVYNEQDNLPKLAESFIALTKSYDLSFVFVDDCSTDNSVNLIGELFDSKTVHVITKEENEGPGHSFNLGFEWILERANSSDLVVTLEADGTSDLSILPTMITLAKTFNYDLVLASVYAQGGGFEQTSFFRKLISFWANIFLRGLFNIKVLTLSSFYRVYKVELLSNIVKRHTTIIEQSGFVCMFEVMLKCVREEARIIEVPMRLRSEARIGKSKMKVMKTSSDYLKFIIAQLMSKK